MSGWSEIDSVPLIRLESPGYKGPLDEKTGFREPVFSSNGGERGIRTLGTLPYTRFPGVLLRPLGHLSVSLRGGYHNSVTFNKKMLAF